MSLILEALKKSEQQRQREKTPNLQSIHQPAAVPAKKSAQPWWLLALFVGICNLAFLGYWFFRPQNIPAPTEKAAASDVSSAAATTNQPETKSPTATEAIPAAPTHNAQETQPEFTQISPRAAQAQAVPANVAPRTEEISELPENVRNNLPAMTFSFHVYSENSEQRTIIINDRRLREGDQISAGLQLLNITQDGVILLFEQHRIHISVLSDW